jgi:hypothetical protein
LFREHVRRGLARAILAVGAVLRSMRAFRLSRLERREIGEDLVRPLEPLAPVGDEKRDLVLALSILLPRRDLLRDVVEAELRQPLADGGRVRAPLRLVEGQHTPLLDAVEAG